MQLPQQVCCSQDLPLEVPLRPTTIMDHLEEEHKARTKKLRQFIRAKKQTLVFMKSAESMHETYLASVKNKMSSPTWGGGTGLQG